MKKLVVLEGKLSNDPVFSNVDGKDSVCTFIMGNNRYYFEGGKLAKEVDSFDITANGVLAQRCIESLKKGDAVLVSGEIINNARDNRVKVVAANIKYIGKRKSA